MEWDMATITAGDYTVEWKIKPETYNNWLSNSYLIPGGGKEQGKSVGYAMKDELKTFL